MLLRALASAVTARNVLSLLSLLSCRRPPLDKS